MKKNIYKILEYFGYLLFGFGIITVFYYIWSPLFTAEFHSDTAEMLLWAQQIVEKNTLISPDFSYSYVIPFGGQLILAPFVKLFGVRIISLRIGMSIIAILFFLAFYLFFHELFGHKHAFLPSGILILMLCGTKSLRELFWAHTVFYSLSVFYGMTALVLAKKLMINELTKRKEIIGFISIFILSVLACTTGAPMLIYFAFPLCGSVIIVLLMSYSDKTPKDNNKLVRKGSKTLVLLLAGVILGFLLSFTFSGDPQDNYSDYYTVLSRANEWAENTSLFPSRWISLFTELNEEPVSLTSPDGIRMSFFILSALFVLVTDFLSLFFVKRLCLLERLIVAYHWLLSLLLLFFFCFGTISNYERRLIPIFVSGIITEFIMIRYLFQCDDLIRKMNAGLLSISLVLAAFVDGISMFIMVPDNSLWYEDGSIMQTLDQNGLTNGYSTDFWFANSITVMTGEKIRVREVTVDEDGYLIQKKNQTDKKWYQEDPNRSKTFLICQEWFVQDHPEYFEKADEVYRSEFTHPVSKKYLGYYILIYNKDIYFTRDQNKASFAFNFG